MKECSNQMISTSQHQSSKHVLESVVEAMLDSLTVEQQTKMASYLLRTARAQNEARHRAAARTAPRLVRIC